jgi:hypothetical protein
MLNLEATQYYAGKQKCSRRRRLLLFRIITLDDYKWSKMMLTGIYINKRKRV